MRLKSIDYYRFDIWIHQSSKFAFHVIRYIEDFPLIASDVRRKMSSSGEIFFSPAATFFRMTNRSNVISTIIPGIRRLSPFSPPVVANNFLSSMSFRAFLPTSSFVPGSLSLESQSERSERMRRRNRRGRE